MTDYSKYFSEDVPSFLRSPVRDIFAKVDLSAICSFAGGYPAAVTFPTEAIKQLSAQVLDKYGPKALQYGATQGVPELRQVIADRYGVPVSRVQITTSSQQGIDVCSRVFLDPGDIVLANNPVYLGALQSFRAYRAQVISLSDYRHAQRMQGISDRHARPDRASVLGHVHAFIGDNDHYKKSGVVSNALWEQLYGHDTITTDPGTHFMEEEFIHELLIPNILELLS